MGREPQNSGVLLYLSPTAAASPNHWEGKWLQLSRSSTSCCFHFLIAESPFYCSLSHLAALQRKTNICCPRSKRQSYFPALSFFANCHLLFALWQSVCKQKTICINGFFCSERKWKLFLQLLNCSLIALLQTHWKPFVCCTICTFTKTCLWNWAFSLQPLPV